MTKDDDDACNSQQLVAIQGFKTSYLYRAFDNDPQLLLQSI